MFYDIISDPCTNKSWCCRDHGFLFPARGTHIIQPPSCGCQAWRLCSSRTCVDFYDSSTHSESSLVLNSRSEGAILPLCRQQCSVNQRVEKVETLTSTYCKCVHWAWTHRNNLCLSHAVWLRVCILVKNSIERPCEKTCFNTAAQMISHRQIQHIKV